MENDILIQQLLKDSPSWWNALKEDKDIYIEIRKDNYIDAYYNGGAIIKKIKWSEKKGYYAKIHAKYLTDTDSNKYEDCPLELLPERLSEIKNRIYKFYPNESEKGIQAKLIINSENYYIDSEFQDTIINENGAKKQIRIDLIRFDYKSEGLTFQELKRIDDSRLLRKGESKGTRELSEIKAQMDLYSTYISKNKDSLSSYYKNLISAKTELGLLPINIRWFYIKEEPQLIISDYAESYTEDSKKGRRVKALIKNLEQEKINYSFVNINTDGYLYKRKLLSIKKSDWDSIFAAIPLIDELCESSPKETNSRRRRGMIPLNKLIKEVTDGAVIAQFSRSISKLFIPFDWRNWEEGISILESHSFSGLDLRTTCKLLTILLCYKESTKKISSFEIRTYCRAEELEDGRILKLLKQLKVCVKEEFKNELVE